MAVRSLFPGYYAPSEDEIARMWRDGLIVPDANVLLTLYRFSDRTRDELIGIFRSVADRLWVPHQAALEYQRNRTKVIAERLAAHDEAAALLEEAREKLVDGLSYSAARCPLPVRDWIRKLEDLLESVHGELEDCRAKETDLFLRDPIRETLDDLLAEKVGEPYTLSQLDEIMDAAQVRYDYLMPPGYMDSGKGGARQYGDFILWRQLIERARVARRPVIFITDDSKEDWWQIVRERTHGPRLELVQEFWSEVGTRIHFYKTDTFMEKARYHLGERVVVDDEAVGEVSSVLAHEAEVPEEEG